MCCWLFTPYAAVIIVSTVEPTKPLNTLGINNAIPLSEGSPVA
jgi:phage tail sheath gpL-like